MSAFTDDDLKRVKERLAVEHNCTDPVLNCGKTKALLARLEAAERAVQFMYISAHPIDESSEEAYQAWRKASGKAGT